MLGLRGIAGAATLVVLAGPLGATSQAKTFRGETSQGRRVIATLDGAHKLTSLKFALSARCDDARKRVFTDVLPVAVPEGRSEEHFGEFGGSFFGGHGFNFSERATLSLDVTSTLVKGTVTVTRTYDATNASCHTGGVRFRVAL